MHGDLVGTRSKILQIKFTSYNKQMGVIILMYHCGSRQKINIKWMTLPDFAATMMIYLLHGNPPGIHRPFAAEGNAGHT